MTIPTSLVIFTHTRSVHFVGRCDRTYHFSSELCHIPHTRPATNQLRHAPLIYWTSARACAFLIVIYILFPNQTGNLMRFQFLGSIKVFSFNLFSFLSKGRFFLLFFFLIFGYKLSVHFLPDRSTFPVHYEIFILLLLLSWLEPFRRCLLVIHSSCPFISLPNNVFLANIQSIFI